MKAWRLAPMHLFVLLAAVFGFGETSGPPAAGQGAEIVLGPPPWDLQPRVRMALQTLASRFQAEQGSARVSITAGLESFDAGTVAWQDLGNILFIPGAEYGQPSMLGRLAERGLLADLTERVMDPAFGKDDFFPNLWDHVTYEGRVRAVPLLVRSWGIAVDTSRFDAELAAEKFQTWEGFLAGQSELIVDGDGDGTPELVDIQVGFSPYTLWSCRFLSLGGDPSDAETFSPRAGAWQGAASYLANLMAANPWLFHAPPAAAAVGTRSSPAVQFVHDDDGGRTSFGVRSGNGGSWVLLPAPGTGTIPPLDTTVLAVKRDAPEVEEASWEFVRWLTSPATMRELYPAFRLTPLRRSVVEAANDEAMAFFASQIERMRFQRPEVEPNAEAVQLRTQLFAEVYGSAAGG